MKADDERPVGAPGGGAPSNGAPSDGAPGAASPPGGGEPPSVVAILRARRWIERHWRLTLVLLAAPLLLVGLMRLVAGSFYTVDNGASAARLRFGRLVDDAIGPGLHFQLPGGIDRVEEVRTGEVLRLPITGDLGGDLDLVTGDENLIVTGLVVQYRISSLGDYLYATEDAQLLVSQAVRGALVEAMAAAPVDDVLTSAKAALQRQVRQVAQEHLDRYDSGVVLVAVNLQSVDPPREAAGAFRQVSDAVAESAQAVSQAEGERGAALRLARGQAAQLVEQAGSAAARRREEASGAVRRFEQLLARQRAAPAGQIRSELYNDTLRRVLPRTRLVVLAPGERPVIDVNLLEPAGDGAPAGPPVHEER